MSFFCSPQALAGETLGPSLSLFTESFRTKAQLSPMNGWLKTAAGLPAQLSTGCTWLLSGRHRLHCKLYLEAAVGSWQLPWITRRPCFCSQQQPGNPWSAELSGTCCLFPSPSCPLPTFLATDRNFAGHGLNCILSPMDFFLHYEFPHFKCTSL